MLNSKEVIGLVLALIVLAFSNSFKDIIQGSSSVFISSLFIFAIILIIYTFAKKLTAYYYGAEEETKIWTFQRYGLYKKSYFKNPIPIGMILPFILSILSLGYIKWFAVTESDVKGTLARATRRHGLYSFSEMTEWHIALISASGIFSMFILAIIAYLFNQPELARLSIYFASFNLLPLGKLDGTRIFFGSRKAALWIILVIIDLVALTYAFFLI